MVAFPGVGDLKDDDASDEYVDHMILLGVVSHGMVWYYMVLYGIAWHRMVLLGVVWHGLYGTSDELMNCGALFASSRQVTV